MQRIKQLLVIVAVLSGALGIFFVLNSEKALVVHPKGIIAQGELSLIKTIIILMLIVVVPTFILLFVTVWKYRAKNTKAKYDPDQSHGFSNQLILWAIPAIIVAIMIAVTWKATHKLDPYVPLDSDVKPLQIQVVALDWKWLFIYPCKQTAKAREL